MYSAAAGGHKKIVQLLIAKGADVNAKSWVEKKTVTSLDVAVQEGHKEVADMLRKQAKAVESIFNAAKEGNLAKVKSMLQEKPELMLNTSYGNNQTLLHQAVLDGQKEIADFLVAKGASIYAKNNHFDAPLHSAVKAGHKDLVELFLNKVRQTLW